MIKFDGSSPSSFNIKTHLDILEDLTDLIKFGEEIERPYMNFEFQGLESSSWNKWPDAYIFISFRISMSSSLKSTARETYGIFDFLGDIGGVMAALDIFFRSIA